MKLSVLFSDGINHEIDFSHSTLTDLFENVGDATELSNKFVSIGHGNSAASLYVRVPQTDGPDVFDTDECTVTLDLDNVYTAQKIRCSVLYTSNKDRQTFFLYPLQEWLYPDGLHPSTADLLQQCTKDLGVKLFQSQIRLGLDRGWKHLPKGSIHIEGKTFLDDESLNKALANHLEKGDTLDSIAYLMFMHVLGVKINLSGDK